MKKLEISKDDQNNQHIKVFVRCRPINDIEKQQNSPSVFDVIGKRRQIVVKEKVNDKFHTKTFGFDKVFGPEAKQVDVYIAVMQPLIEEVLMGFNCTVFAYGQTGTGKTYTMEGERNTNIFSWEDDSEAGIIPRFIHQLFVELKNRENVKLRYACVSFFEMYNDELFDLLRPTEDLSKICLFEESNKKGPVLIQGLKSIVVFSKDDVYYIWEKGTARRQTATTRINASSSQSHTVFSISITIQENMIDGEVVFKKGTLNLVDLAGSENVGCSGAVDKIAEASACGKRAEAREAGNANQSLLTFQRVITSLAEKAPHIPYRESKFTRFFQDCLGGHTKTSIIATISPALCNIQETTSTLYYAHLANNIINRPEVNQRKTNCSQIDECREEIERLYMDMAERGERDIFFL